MSFYREQLETFLRELDVEADLVLDIGGKELPIQGRTKSWHVKEYKILDLPEFNLEEQQQTTHLADLIFCLEVFEYIIDPVTAIKNLANELRQGGRAYVTFPFVYPHHNQLEWDSLRYTEPGIVRLAEKARLTIENITYRVDKSGLLTKFYAADGMRAAKQYGHHNVTGFTVEFSK